jgi:hypothetical protein
LTKDEKNDQGFTGEIIDNEDSFESIEIESLESERSQEKQSKKKVKFETPVEAKKTGSYFVQEVSKIYNPDDKKQLLEDVKKKVDGELRKIERNVRKSKLTRFDIRQNEQAHSKMLKEIGNFEEEVNKKVMKLNTMNLRYLLERKKQVAREFVPEARRRVIDHCKEIEKMVQGMEDREELEKVYQSMV